MPVKKTEFKIQETETQEKHGINTLKCSGSCANDRIGQSPELFFYVPVCLSLHAGRKISALGCYLAWLTLDSDGSSPAWSQQSVSHMNQRGSFHS